jgi:Uma2 family endonuclease
MRFWTMGVNHLVTVEELWALPEKPGVRYELVAGELVEVPAAGALHNLIAALVYELLRAFVREHDLGLVFTDGMGYILDRDPDLLRIPDVSFVSWARVPEDGAPEGYWPGAPDLAVEVVSPHDRADDVHDKVREYLESGARLVWVLWPKRRSVTAHTPDGVTRELDSDDELLGGDALPDFRVRVADLFAVRGRRQDPVA